MKFGRLVLALLFGLGLSGAVTALAQAQETLPLNSLSPDEQAAGWRLLFDGKTTAGWHSWQRKDVGTEWQVLDGVLTLTRGGGGDLITDATYENFELSLEWKISEKGNSGVFFRVIESDHKFFWQDNRFPYQSGLEYQLLDNAHLPEGPIEQAASLFALYPPSQDVTRPTGEFNLTRIVVDHGHVEHWLNGVKVVDYVIGSPDFLARVAKSKFASWPDYSIHPIGHIGLQDHGSPVAFRSIKIRPLP